MRREPILQLTDATVIKGDRPALEQLTLAIHEGEHTAILGPNGAGKSVLVGLLTHHERALAPSDGAPPPVRVFGEDNWNVWDLRAQLGIVSSDLHHRFVRGNSEGRVTAEAAVLSAFFASHGVLRYGTVTRAMRNAAAEALEAAGASHLVSRMLHEMSSGEARRVLLARVLVTKPRALVLDEPTTGLDLAARHAFMERVRAIIRDGPTLILVTHHIEEIVPEITRIIFLREGKIAGDGPKCHLLTSARVSELFGLTLAIGEAGGYYSATY